MEIFGAHEIKLRNVYCCKWNLSGSIQLFALQFFLARVNAHCNTILFVFCVFYYERGIKELRMFKMRIAMNLMRMRSLWSSISNKVWNKKMVFEMGNWKIPWNGTILGSRWRRMRWLLLHVLHTGMVSRNKIDFGVRRFKKRSSNERFSPKLFHLKAPKALNQHRFTAGPSVPVQLQFLRIKWIAKMIQY